MLERFKCVVCGRSVEMDTEDPLHFTNWSVGHISKPVCSEACKSAIVLEFQAAYAKQNARIQSKAEERRSNLKKVKAYLNTCILDGTSYDDVFFVWRAVASMLEEEDDD